MQNLSVEILHFRRGRDCAESETGLSARSRREALVHNLQPSQASNVQYLPSACVLHFRCVERAEFCLLAARSTHGHAYVLHVRRPECIQPEVPAQVLHIRGKPFLDNYVVGVR